MSAHLHARPGMALIAAAAQERQENCVGQSSHPQKTEDRNDAPAQRDR